MAAWVVAIVCACACPGANALALQDIEKAYDTKLEALGEYRIQYVLSVEYTESGAVTSGHTRIERVLSGEGGYRIEQLIPGDALAPAILQRVQTDNGQQCRTLPSRTTEFRNPAYSSLQVRLLRSMMPLPIYTTGPRLAFMTAPDVTTWRAICPL